MIFRKFCAKSRLSEIWTKYEIIKHFCPTKPEMISENFDKNRDFQKLWLKSTFFENFDHCWDFEIFFCETDIFENFDQNRFFFLKLWQKSTFLEILNQIENLVNFEQNRDFRKTIKKWRFSYKILTNIKISNRFDKISIFSKILTRMEVFKKCFYQNEHFRKFGPKSRFSENLDPKTKFGIFENFEKISGFSKF